MTLYFPDELGHCIEARDPVALVDLIEPRISAGSATPDETLLCGVTLIMAPLADYEAARGILRRLLTGDRGFEAAIWLAYLYAELIPDGDRPFEAILRQAPHSAVAAHLRSMVAASEGDLDVALLENRRSRALRMFPANIVKSLYWDDSLVPEERRILWKTAQDLIYSRSAENDPAPYTAQGALQSYWENLILSTRLSSVIWDKYSRIFGSS